MTKYTYADMKKAVLVETFLYFKLLAYVFSPPLSYGAYKIGISPNQITTLGILLVIPAIYFNLQGYYIFGILMFHLFFLCDAVDGILARGTNRKSKLGGYLDDLSHLIFHTGFFIAMGFSMYKAGHVRLGMMIILFLILDNIKRMHSELAYRMHLNRGHVSYYESSAGNIAKVRDMFLGSFTFPNSLVWLTLLIWNLQLLEVYFIYAVVFSLLYFLYSVLKNVLYITKNPNTIDDESVTEIEPSDG